MWIRTRENEVSASSQNAESQELARKKRDLTQKILSEHTRQNLSDGTPPPAQYPEGHTRLQEKQGDRKYQNVPSPSYEVEAARSAARDRSHEYISEWSPLCNCKDNVLSGSPLSRFRRDSPGFGLHRGTPKSIKNQACF